MFIISDSSSIDFRKYSVYSCNDVYSPKYDVAFLDDAPIKNDKGFYLSRICKKNGKHRYYITQEHEIYTCNGCGKEGCCSRYCRGGLDYNYYYVSKYVGKNIDSALTDLLKAVVLN